VTTSCVWNEVRGEPLFAGGTDELVWFVAPATVVIRDDDGNEGQAPYRVSGMLERARNGRRLFRLFNGSEPAGRSSARRR
jgi:hypothetical protein